MWKIFDWFPAFSLQITEEEYAELMEGRCQYSSMGPSKIHEQ